MLNIPTRNAIAADNPVKANGVANWSVVRSAHRSAALQPNPAPSRRRYASMGLDLFSRTNRPLIRKLMTTAKTGISHLATEVLGIGRSAIEDSMGSI
jgi:hypothetical protein